MTVKVQQKKVGIKFDDKYAESKYRQNRQDSSLAEVLAITQTNRLPNREQLLQLVECYENESMTNIMRKK